MAQFFSRAFGLTLESEVPIPGLLDWPAAAPDVRIHAGFLPEWIDTANGTGREIWSAGGDPDHESDAVSVRAAGNDRFLLLAYGDGTRFVVSRSGDEIWCAWLSNSTLATAATYLLGPVIGLVLRLRDITCLHASVVAIGDHAIAIVGPAGLGKSTTAAAFALRGYRVLADDIAAIGSADAGWHVHPAVPSIRLWEDSVELLLGDASALPRMAPGWDKRQLDLREVGGGFLADAAAPLAAIYILAEHDATGGTALPRRLSPRDALMALVSNTYANVLLDGAMRAAEFVALSRLVSEVPVWQIDAAHDAAALDTLCATLVANHAGRR